MKEEITANLNNPAQLEKLYRADKSGFKRAFNNLNLELNNSLTDFWNERLNFNNEEVTQDKKNELLFVIGTALIAGIIAKLPAILNIEEAYFYSRNIGFIVFPLLTAYFAWINHLSINKIAIVFGATLFGLIFINTIPFIDKSDTTVLSSIHLILFLWTVLGFAFVGNTVDNTEKRLSFLKYNGDLLVISALILIAGAILSGITIGLFSIIGFKIERFYYEYVVIFGLPAVPIVGTYLTQTNPQLVGKVSPVIAKIFSPLVLIMLVIYLVAMVYSGKDPYKDREFLIIFNALLIGVMALIFFSMAETAKTAKSSAEIWTLFLLSVLTAIVNCIALSAILFRIAEWGITPNRAAVMGGNILILINLFLVVVQLYKVLFKKTAINQVGKAIAIYLPVYAIWTIVVTFIFPFLFGFK